MELDIPSLNIRGREAPILLRGSYVLNWKDYARINDQRNGLFRFLYIPVTKEVDETGEKAASCGNLLAGSGTGQPTGRP